MTEPARSVTGYSSMNMPRTSLASAPTTIAAVLALSATFAAPALAQSAPADPAPAAAAEAPAPAPAAPTVMAAPAAPAIVLPPATPSAPTSVAQPQLQAQVQTLPQTAGPAEPAAPRTVTRTPPRAVERVARPAPAAAAAAPMASPISAPAPAPAAAGQQPAASEQAITAEPTAPRNSGNAWGLGLSLLAVLGLGGALVATRSRRRVIEDDAAYEPASYVAEPPVMTGVEVPFVTEPDMLDEIPPSSNTMVAAEAVGSALIEEMVAMPPDADNPFKTRKMRRKRARQLLAQRDMADAAPEELVTPGFDWRTYQPSSARNTTEKV